MKNKLLLLLLLFSTNLFAQIVNIPDSNFLFRLLHHTGFGGVHIDTNNNNQIEVSEAEAVTELMLGDPFATDYQIINMTGIEAFKNITSLQCMINQIESLDLSQNTKLEILDCHDNNISSLDVTNCTLLREIYCQENNLPSLDVSQNVVLENLRCNENYLSTLNVAQNTILKNLFCSENYISVLNVEQNILLEWLTCGNNQITNLNVSQNTLLKKLYFGNNLIMTIDLDQCTLLERLGGGGNQLTGIDLIINSNLYLVYLENNQLASMDIKNGNNSIITNFDTTNNPNLACIFVDDANYSTDNWTDIDPNSTFVETQAACDAIGVGETALEQINIFPNPCSDILTISILERVQDYKITITDALGKNINTKKSIQTESIDLSFLKAGYYLIRITNNKYTLTHKIIKL